MALGKKVQDIIEESKNPLVKINCQWERVSLELIADILNGFAFKSTNYSKEKGIPLLRIRDIGKNTTEIRLNGSYDDIYLVESGDIIIGMDGDFKSDVWLGEKALLNQRVCKLKCISTYYEKRFLKYLLPGYLNEINKETSSVTVKHLSSKSVNEIQLPLPPLSEQHRIVDKIEELFINLDAGIEALKKVQAQLKRYRQSILKAAVEGRLTEEWREQHKDELEPADKLLDRILKERREKWETEQLTTYKAQSKTPPRKWQENYKQPKPPDTTDLHKLPKDWVWTNLGEITWQIKDGPHYSPKYSNEGIPFITGGNVRPNGIDFKNVKRISRDLHEKLSKRIKPELGDILYSKGGTTGIARVNTYEFEFNVWVHVAVLKLADPLIPFYIQHALNSPFCYMQSQKYTHGVGNQDLGLTRMVNISVPLPPVKEQIQIISIVESFLLLIERFESLLYTELKRAQSLRQSILKRAFEGKLVPQDPNDEPASILLEKIKAEKAKSINTKQLEMF